LLLGAHLKGPYEAGKFIFTGLQPAIDTFIYTTYVYINKIRPTIQMLARHTYIHTYMVKKDTQTALVWIECGLVNVSKSVIISTIIFL
jgi:hypothetical protein